MIVNTTLQTQVSRIVPQYVKICVLNGMQSLLNSLTLFKFISLLLSVN